MSYPHSWDDPRAQAEYAARHRYESFPEGHVDGVDPGRYHTQESYYAAQYEAYMTQQYLLQDMTWGMPRAIGSAPLNMDDFSFCRLAQKATQDLVTDFGLNARFTSFCSAAAKEELRRAAKTLSSAISDIEESDQSDYAMAVDFELLADKYRSKLYTILSRERERQEKEEKYQEPEESTTGAWQRFMRWLRE